MTDENRMMSSCCTDARNCNSIAKEQTKRAYELKIDLSAKEDTLKQFLAEYERVEKNAQTSMENLQFLQQSRANIHSDLANLATASVDDKMLHSLLSVTSAVKNILDTESTMKANWQEYDDRQNALFKTWKVESDVEEFRASLQRDVEQARELYNVQLVVANQSVLKAKQVAADAVCAERSAVEALEEKMKQLEVEISAKKRKIEECATLASQ